MSEESTDPFDRLHCGDGFRVNRVELGGNVSLHICAYQDGVVSNLFNVPPEDASVEVAEWRDPSPADLGASTRLELVLDAICRYLTTGGNWNELNDAVGRMKRVAVGGIVYAGYHLLESYSNTEGDYEHIFVKNGTTEAVLWVEDQFIDRKSLEQIRREQEEAEEGEDGEEDLTEDTDSAERPYLGDQGNLLSGPDHPSP
jgi:hypothetical protein